MPNSKAPESVSVGLGEVKTTQDPREVLTCLGLGSCVGVCMYDPVAKLAGMVHIVLPDSYGEPEQDQGKYADTGVPLLLNQMIDAGALKSRIIVKIAGGARMSRAKGIGDAFRIGERNAEAVQTALDNCSLSIKATDTGGHHGRTMRFYLDTERTEVTTHVKEIRDL